MNLQPFYDLRDRLQAAAKAGSNLITEDFRLKRAAEAIAPFAKASAVFQKIEQQLNTLLGSSCQDRSLLLLDTLALVDAVLVTQGSLAATAAEKEKPELEPLGREEADEAFFQNYQDISSKIFRIFSETDIKKEKEQWKMLQEMQEQSPNMFKDERILKHLVSCLDANDLRISNYANCYLKEYGKNSIPSLKEGFSRAERKGKMLRLLLLEELAGGEENAFYLEQFSQEQGGIREALVEWLRFDKSNAKVILSILRNKKESPLMRRKAAWTSGFMDDTKIQKYWQMTDLSPSLLKGSPQAWAGDVVADTLLELMRKIEADKIKPSSSEEREELVKLYDALWECKTERMPGIMRSLAAQAERLKAVPNAERWIWSDVGIEDRTYVAIDKKSVHPELASLFMANYIAGIADGAIEEDREYVLAVAEAITDVWKTYGEMYLNAAFAAALFTKPAAEVYEEFETYLELELSSVASGKRGYHPILRTLNQLRYHSGWTGGFEGYTYQFRLIDRTYSNRSIRKHGPWQDRFEASIPKRNSCGFDLRWYDSLFAHSEIPMVREILQERIWRYDTDKLIEAYDKLKKDKKGRRIKG